jgi:cobalt-zinc-cadmium efflux system outer membrane protein
VRPTCAGEAVPAVSLSALVGEIIAKNPERQFYQEEITAAKAGVRLSSRLNDPELSFDHRQQTPQRLHRRAHRRRRRLVGVGHADLRVARSPLICARPSPIARSSSRNWAVARFENALATRARTLAFGLYAANAKAAAIREVSDRFTALKETFLARDPAGVTPLLETRVIEASELTLQRRATEAELALQGALIELNQLRGVAVDAPLRVAAPSLTFNTMPDTAALLAAAVRIISTTRCVAWSWSSKVSR